MAQEKIVIGRVLKPQGVRGEIKVQPITNDPARFGKLKALYVGDFYYKILSMSIRQGFVYLFLGGVSTRDDAEKLAGKDVQIERIHAAALSDGEYYITDLVGCKLIVDGAEVGVVESILQNGAADVYEVRLSNKQTLLFPFLRSLNLKIDTEKGIIEVSGQVLSTVAVYSES